MEAREAFDAAMAMVDEAFELYHENVFEDGCAPSETFLEFLADVIAHRQGQGVDDGTPEAKA